MLALHIDFGSILRLAGTRPIIKEIEAKEIWSNAASLNSESVLRRWRMRHGDISNGSSALASSDLIPKYLRRLTAEVLVISNHTTTTLHILHNVFKTCNSLGKPTPRLSPHFFTNIQTTGLPSSYPRKHTSDPRPRAVTLRHTVPGTIPLK